MSARETALRCLIAIRREGAWSNATLKSQIGKDNLDARDAALASRLCYGVVQNRLLLEYYLSRLRSGGKKLHPAVRDCLHLGLYQILLMDKIPDSAAVNESVSLCRNAGHGEAAGLVNAVLRRAVREKDSLLPPAGYAERYSHPEELITLLKKNLPKGHLEKMLIADNSVPETVVQVNTLKTTADALRQDLESRGITAAPHPWMPDCLVLEHTGNLEKLDAFRQGLFYVQDCASKLSVQCAKLTANRAVLDCCAAPGGKSFAAAISMAGTGSLTSCDIHPHKAGLIENGAARLGLQNVSARVQDASAFVPEWEGAFDTVIVDAPCSGLGIIRKKPDIRYKPLAPMEALPALQLSILENQSRYVRPGGVLLYSTCTVLKRENEDVVTAFLRRHPEFSLTPLELPAVFPENTTGMLTLIPGEYDTDGFFISRMEKKL